MKTFYIFTLLILFPALLFCQQENEALTDSTISYRWDTKSNVWINSSRVAYIYDDLDNQIEVGYYAWDNTINQWVGTIRSCRRGCWGGRETFVYDEKGNPTEHIYYSWNNETQKWHITIRTVYAYDNAGNQTEGTSYRRDSGTDNWIRTYRTVYAYDTSGNQIESSPYSWDNETQTWRGSSHYCGHFGCGGGKQVSTYSLSGNKTAHYICNWDEINNSWINYLKRIYTYDASDRLVREMDYIWDAQNQDWKFYSFWIGSYPPGWHKAYEYDEQGNLTEFNRYSLVNNAWVPGMREVYVYDEKGNKTETTCLYWDSEKNEWSISQREQNTYDSNGNRIEQSTYTWDSEKNIWKVYRREIVAFDAFGNQREYSSWGWDSATNDWKGKEHYVEEFDEYGNTIERINYAWNSEMNNWVEEHRSTTVYSYEKKQSTLTNADWDSQTLQWINTNKKVSYWSYRVFNNLPLLVEENSPDSIMIGAVILKSQFEPGKYRFFSDGGDSAIQFEIDSLSGEVLLLNGSALDYETKNYFYINVLFHTYDSTANATFKVHVTNVNDNFPVINDTTFTFYENGNPRNSKGFITGCDADGLLNPLNYTLLSGNESNAFVLDTLSGKLSVISGVNLDYEVQNRYDYKVRISDGMYADTANVVILISDLNEHAPYMRDAYFSIDENSAEGTILGQLDATDYDSFRNSLHYSILSGNSVHAFSIDPLTGNLIVNSSDKIDFETQIEYTLEIQVSDGAFTDSALVKIKVNNVNDNAPVLNDTTFTFYENGNPRNSDGFVTGFDPDGSLNPLNYTILSGNESNAFVLDTLSGKLSVISNVNLDYDMQNHYDFKVRISDGMYADTANIAIIVSDLNEHAPHIREAYFTIDENSTEGTILGQLDATDYDSFRDSLHYSILSGDSAHAFSIDPLTRNLIVNSSDKIDFETQTEYTLEIQVSDGKFTDTALVTLLVKNLNDNPPVIQDATYTINENSKGIWIYNISDLDGYLDPFHFKIISGNEGNTLYFDANNNLVSTINFDYERQVHYNLEIMVSDGFYSDTCTIIIDVINLNDNPIVLKEARFSIDESCENGQEVGVLTARDPDGLSTNFSYSIIMGNDNSAFILNSKTGSLSVHSASQIDFETQSLHRLVVQVTDGEEIKNAIVKITVIDVDETPISKTLYDKQFKIFPNPTKGHLKIKTELPGKYTIQICAVNGKVMHIIQMNENLLEIDMSSYKNGVYFITIRSDAMVWTEKVVKTQ